MLAIAIVAWELSGSARQAHPALTAKRRLHLERYCTIADRMMGAGAGARYLLDVILGHKAITSERVCSLDYFVTGLRRWVRATRRARRGLPPIPHERAGWYEEREERRRDEVMLARRAARRRVPSDDEIRERQLPPDLRRPL